MFVKAGYLEPEEVQKYSSELPYADRMERASRIFYNHVQNYAPDFMSPQYEGFFKASEETVKARQPPKTPMISFEERHDLITLSSVSNALSGLAE